MERLRGADIVAELLVRQGIRYIAGVPGHTVLDLVDALYDRRDQITAIMTRNEEAAGYIADAYYRIRNEPMAIMAHNSVGAANILTGVMNARLDSSAMIVITGEVWTRSQGRGAFQELDSERDAGTPDIFRGSVKRSWQVNRAEKLPEVMLKAFKEAVSGRPGPVHVDITQEALAERVDVHLPSDMSLYLPAFRTRGDPAAVRRAADLLASASRPAILAGSGCLRSQATDEIVVLAERLGIPVATTAMGKGIFPETHPLALGITGWVGTLPGNKAMREADVLLALGTGFTETDTVGWQDGKIFGIPPTRVIQVDIDPTRIARYYPIEVGIVGDVRSVLLDILAQVGDAPPSGGYREWTRELDEAKGTWRSEVQEVQESDSVPIAPGRLTRTLQEVLSDDAIIITDVGNSQKWILQQYEVSVPRTIVTSLNGASMGFGPCGAIGVQLAEPSRQVVAVTGDGSMSMSLHTLPTAVEYDLPIIFVVANDYAYGSVKRPQDMRFGPGRNHFTIFEERTGQPYRLDFAAVAHAVGMKAERVIRPEELAPALRRASVSSGPYLLDVEVELDTYVPMSGGGGFALPTAE